MGGSITSFVPLAPIHLVKPNGDVRDFGLGASTDAARGTALLAAQTAAVSGDLIRVYCDCNPAGVINKDGVRWWFGAVRIYGTAFGIGTVNGTIVIDGYAIFENTGTVGCLGSSGASSVVSIKCRKIIAGSNGAAVITAGTTRLEVSEAIIAGGYDGIWVSADSVDTYISCPFVDAGQDALEIEGPCTLRLGKVYGDQFGLNALSGCAAIIYADELNGAVAAIGMGPSPSGDPATVELHCSKILNVFRYLSDDSPGTGSDTMRVVGAEFANLSDVIEVAGTGLILEDCVFLTSSGNIMSDGGGSATIRGTYTATRPFGLSSITYSGTAGNSVKLAGTTPTAAGLALIDDATTAIQRATLGVNKKIIAFQVFAPTVGIPTGDGAAYFHVPASLNGADITSVHAQVITAGTTGTTDIQIARVRSGSPADVLSTKLTIDSTETGSDTAATAAVINTSNDDLATNDLLRIDVDATSTTKAKGLIVTIEATL